MLGTTDVVSEFKYIFTFTYKNQTHKGMSAGESDTPSQHTVQSSEISYEAIYHNR